jgi:2-oxoglutarate ferredoxin oxidoreductase subunit gamma
MPASVILSGFGGQGLLFAGQVLAQAALNEHREVTWLPSYGPEMRGGTASCTVIVSDHPIGSPIADVADIVLALNPPSLARFEPAVAEGGLLVLNGSLIEALPSRRDIDVLRIPCSALASDAGDERVVSVIALGAAIARRPIVSIAALMTALEIVAAKGGATVVQRNERSLLAGVLAGHGALEGAAA